MFNCIVGYVCVGLKYHFWCFRFNERENLTGVNNVKSSVQKAIRSKLLEQFPYLDDYLDQILPKKDPLRVAKW